MHAAGRKNIGAGGSRWLAKIFETTDVRESASGHSQSKETSIQ
jgi:hypothetical protein